MPEIYGVLLLFAGAAGWYFAYVFYHGKKQPKIPGEYIQGLNYLLNEQPDNALEIFINLVEVDTETVETHLVLGNMFRRRGEVDRAIRVHQNLIAKPSLEPLDKSTAFLELAKDYLKAGLLDRAETLLVEVIEIGLRSDQAYPLLLSLYEREKEWQRAIDTAKEMARISGKKVHRITAHYYCELSQIEFEKSRDGIIEAKKLAKRALRCDKHCARASVLLGDYAMHEENHKSAIKYYQAVATQNPQYLPEVLMKIRTAFARLGDTRGFREFLASSKDTRFGGILLATLLSNLAADDAERKIISGWLLDKPQLSLLEISAFLHSIQAEAGSPEARSLSGVGLRKLHSSIDSFMRGYSSHQCGQCGFRAKTLYWQCPGCHYWGAVVPVMPSLN